MSQAEITAAAKARAAGERVADLEGRLAKVNAVLASAVAMVQADMAAVEEADRVALAAAAVLDSRSTEMRTRMTESVCRLVAPGTVKVSAAVARAAARANGAAADLALVEARQFREDELPCLRQQADEKAAEANRAIAKVDKDLEVVGKLKQAKQDILGAIGEASKTLQVAKAELVAATAAAALV